MATSQKQKALGIARLLAVAGVVLVGALFTVPRGPAQPGETPSPAQVSKALRLAIEFHKNRDFTQAAGYFDIARDGQQSLSAAEQKELATFGGYNAAALKSQQEGAAQVRLAEEAVQQGRLQDAVPLVNALNSNQNLSPADRATLADLNKAMQAKAAPTGQQPKGNFASLLVSGRNALNAGDLEAAETFAVQAEKASSIVPSWPWSDSPAKLRRDIQAAKAKQQAAANPAPKGDSSSWLANLNPFGGASKNEGPAPGGRGEAEMARQMVRDGFTFLEHNDIEKAKIIAFETKKFNVKWEPNERTPDHLMQEIQRRTGGAEMLMANAHVEPKTEVAPKKKEIATPKFNDARQMVQYARHMLQQKQLDEADKVCTMAINTPTRWGLFEDNPEKLRRDIAAARVVTDRDESIKLMADARKLLASGNIEEAEKKAFRAKQLHGPSGVFDFSDRPDKLIDDINRARQARGIERPNPLEKKDALAKGTNDVPAGTQMANKNRAIVMIREARELERQGKLWEARQKALEARAFRAPFTPDEESPEHVLMSLSARCDRQITTHLQQAVEIFGNANDPQRNEKLQFHLTNAQKLAKAFDLDATRIHQAEQQLHQVAAGTRPIATVSGAIMKGADPFKIEHAHEQTTGDAKKDELRRIGREKLQYAQRELIAGKYSIARKLAEEAHHPQYGIQDEVQRFVRSINAEEYNQQLLEAKRNFDVGVDALAARDYKKAMFIFQQIDPLMLPDHYQARLRDIMSMREMQPIRLAQAEMIKGGKIVEKGTYDPPANPQDDLLNKVQAAETVLKQALRQRGADALRKAHELWKQDAHEEAIKTLRAYIDQVNISQLDTAAGNDLRRPIETRLQQYAAMQADRALAKAERNNNFVMKYDESGNQANIRKKQEQIVTMMKEAHEHYKNNKLAEAEKISRQVLEIDRENGPALMMLKLAETRRKQEDWDRTEVNRWDFFADALKHDRLKNLTTSDPVDFDRKFVERNRTNEPYIYQPLKDEKERKIQYRLKQPISFNFKDAPLQQVIQDLTKLSGVQVQPDMRALQEARIDVNAPLSSNVEDVDMKFALNILLNPLHLTYIIEDQVLKITTENRTRGRLVRVTYPVGDLIVPVEDHPLPDVLDIRKAIERSMMPPSFFGAQSMMPPAYGLNQPVPVSSHSGGLASAFGSQNPNGGMPGPMNKEKTKDEMARILKDLIMNTIAKDKWEDMGGNGSIQYFPMGLAMVINQPQEVQEEIQLLLATLRKLQDLQVSVELRAVLVSETFFERIGLDFDMNIRTPTNSREGSLVTGNFVPAPFVNRFGSGLNGLLAGLTPAGTFTPDLNVPIRNSTFNFTTPQFGGYQPEAGLSLGLAFLSDIQVFMFLEAVQGDRRAHIMQAPKISVYNGQQATIGGFMLRPTVSGVFPAPLSNGNVILIPNITPMPFGLTMTVQPVVSPDRRFIRLNVTPQLAAQGIQDPAGAIVIAVPQQVTGVFDGGAQQPPLPTGPLNVQVNPTTANLLIANTTVNVPDGGTVLLGGFKFLAEERTEYGPPILSKIPYLSRLFRNVGWSRDGSTLIYLVTARVIMIEEEEGLFMGTIPPIPGR